MGKVKNRKGRGVGCMKLRENRTCENSKLIKHEIKNHYQLFFICRLQNLQFRNQSPDT